MKSVLSVIGFIEANVGGKTPQLKSLPDRPLATALVGQNLVLRPLATALVGQNLGVTTQEINLHITLAKHRRVPPAPPTITEVNRVAAVGSDWTKLFLLLANEIHPFCQFGLGGTIAQA